MGVLRCFGKFYKIICFCFFNIVFHLGECATISETFNQIVQASYFCPAPKTYARGDTLVNLLRPILQDHLETTNYDRILPAELFLKYYMAILEKGKKVAPKDALRNFRLKVYDHNPSFRFSGPCVNLTYEIFHRLPQGIQGYICGAKLPKKYQQFAFPEYCHTAILISFENPEDPQDRGFILLDPSFDFYEPLLIRENQETVIDMNDKGKWKFHCQGDEIICNIVPKNIPSYEPKMFRMTYRTDRFLNPVEASALPMVLVDRRLSFLSRNKNGEQIAHLNIEFDKKRIIWDLHGNRFDPIPIEEMLNGTFTFPKQFCSALYISQSKLQERCLFILNNLDVLNSLYKTYLESIYNTGDFSITGEIDMGELEDRINRLNLPI